ncbi:TetR/AcrR family transcriptional regulator [Ktedonosporobacter rubrisoli]|uniref:TetR/AcrR family transcriptional regulator n=1 Tax=Ktedonosporobacter rubrisoli TaxID=2509675 RepID=A0A4P6JL99_KTERU|nr:TetR/AcrR family transcriptional regulator [Ktedonosporobacter rubrisoli]QBD75979.1 TetR/AcrR family transcriptional regulator [Ktedonosporobacter rubrisoli]
MARTVKEDEYIQKRNEILDATRQLIYSKGYEQMTIQDILAELQISKGAFYHYFGSKQAVLEALIERLQEERDQVISPLVQDPQLSAQKKLQGIFEALAQWKTAQKSFLLAIWRALYSDDNALFRQKWHTAAFKQVPPMLATVIRQGIQEGTFTATYPEQSGEVIFALMLTLAETQGSLLLSYVHKADEGLLSHVEQTIAAYTEAIERTLGAARGSFQLVDPQTLREWFTYSGHNV